MRAGPHIVRVLLVSLNGLLEKRQLLCILFRMVATQ